MIDFTSVFFRYSEDLDAVESWVNTQYQEKFACYFEDQRQLFERMKSKTRQISDMELENVLVNTPLQLFAASEVLNTIRLRHESLKLETKQVEYNLAKDSNESTETKRKEFAAMETVQDKLLLLMLESLITRVENEMSFSRELIMSAKKIWDSRRRSETSNPVDPTVTQKDEIGEYIFNK